MQIKNLKIMNRGILAERIREPVTNPLMRVALTAQTQVHMQIKKIRKILAMIIVIAINTEIMSKVTNQKKKRIVVRMKMTAAAAAKMKMKMKTINFYIQEHR